MGSANSLLFLTNLVLTFHTLFCFDFDILELHPIVSVDDFGAIGDGISFDNESFEKGWNEACASTEQTTTVFLVPEGKSYLLKPIKFDGPCESKVIFQIKGKLLATSDRSYWNEMDPKIWIEFYKLRHFVVNGGGEINGNGQIWWEHSCKRNESLPCVTAPTALLFNSTKDLLVENLNIIDSQQMHLVVNSSASVQISNLSIIAPGKSPNTDGIHISHSRFVNVKDSFIATGDDCVSIVSGSKNIRVDNIRCGPGHGLSIGSLGKNHTKAHVENIVITNSFLNSTTNGARIKSWQGGKGTAKRILYQNITMYNVSHPIIIDQNYCDQKGECPPEDNAVMIENVVFDNIKGTSAIEKPITFDCGLKNSCRRVTVKDIDLIGIDGNETKSNCSNIQLINLGNVRPPLCQ